MATVHKVSTTGQRKAALAQVMKAVTRGQRIGDATVCKKHGVSKMVTRLLRAGFITPTDKTGYYKPTENLTTWTPDEILDLVFQLKNGKESKVLKRIEKGEQAPGQIPFTGPTLGEIEDKWKILTPLIPVEQIKELQGATGCFSYVDNRVLNLPYQEALNRIQEAMVLADRYGVTETASFILDYMLERKK